MSQENVEIVHRTYEAIRRRDVEGCIREMHPEVQGTVFVSTRRCPSTAGSPTSSTM